MLVHGDRKLCLRLQASGPPTHSSQLPSYEILNNLRLDVETRSKKRKRKGKGWTNLNNVKNRGELAEYKLGVTGWSADLNAPKELHYFLDLSELGNLEMKAKLNSSGKVNVPNNYQDVESPVSSND